MRAHAQRAVSADGQRACVAPTGANRQWGAGESIWGSSRAVRRGALVVMIFDTYKQLYQSIRAFPLLIDFSQMQLPYVSPLFLLPSSAVCGEGEGAGRRAGLWRSILRGQVRQSRFIMNEMGSGRSVEEQSKIFSGEAKTSWKRLDSSPLRLV